MRLHLEWLQAHTSSRGVAAPVAPARPWHRWRVPIAAGLVGAVLAATPLVVALSRVPDTVPTLQARRFDIALPTGIVLRGGVIPDTPEISPDGLWVVYGATVKGRRQLHLRSMTTQAWKVLVDNQDVAFPFWSPDSQKVAFFAGRSLKTIDIAGGATRALASAPIPLGGTWGRGPHPVRLGGVGHEPARHPGRTRCTRFPKSGGTPALVEGLPALQGNNLYGVPRLLPDGRAFLVHTYPEPSLRLASLDTAGARDCSSTVWRRSARLRRRHTCSWCRTGTLVARPFDAGTGQFTGPDVSLMDGVRSVSAARDGTIVFHATRGVGATQPTWFDRKGARRHSPNPPSTWA